MYSLFGEADALEPQRHRAAGDDIGVIPEQSDQIRGKNEAGHTNGDKYHGGNLHAEPKAFFYPVVKLGTVIEATDRLETLAEAQHGGSAEHGDPLHNAHGGDDGVTMGTGGVIQTDGGKGCQALPGQRRQTAPKDHMEIVKPDADVLQPDADIAALAAAEVQQAETDKLADDGGPAGAGNTQTCVEDQNGIENDVQHRTGGDAHHGVHGAALKAELIIQHEGCRDPGCAQQDHLQIGLGVGQDGVRRAQKIGKGLQEDLTQDTDHRTDGQRAVKTGGSHFLCLFLILFAQRPGNEGTAALTEEETHSLNNGHHGEDHAHRAGGGIILQLTDEEGVSHIIKGGHQHTDDAGDSQFADQLFHRRLRHLLEFQFLRGHENAFFL